jgi:Ca2+-binding RTX toxin-like protein
MAFVRGTNRLDRLIGTDDSDFILGTDDSDFIFSLAGDDVAFAGAGNDYVDAGLGDDHVDGGDGNDFLIGGFGNDVLEGGRGGDLLVDSTILASVQPDSMRGIQDDDVMNGGDGDDFLVSAFGNDIMNGGDGNDIFVMLKTPSSFETGVRVVTMSGGAGDDFAGLAFDQSPIEKVDLIYSGDDGNDTLVVNWLFTGNLTFFGGAGDDRVVVDFLEGDPDQPVIVGSVFDSGDIPPFDSGERLLIGGPGRDSLTGGPGTDKFVFGSPEEGPDSINAFTPGIDQILVSASGFGNGLAPGALAADQFVAGSDPLPVGGQGLFLYDTDDGALSWDADGSGVNASPVTIATLLNHPALSAADFLIF